MREREGIDLSKVRLTHHNLKGLGKQPMPLGGDEYPKLPPITESGSGAVQEKLRAHLSEIIAKVNDLFQGELTDQTKLVYVNDVLKGKLSSPRRSRSKRTTTPGSSSPTRPISSRS